MENQSTLAVTAHALGEEQLLILLENSLIRYHDTRTLQNKHTVEFYIKLAYAGMALDNLGCTVDKALELTTTTNIDPFY